jgi:hypothetical protein
MIAALFNLKISKIAVVLSAKYFPDDVKGNFHKFSIPAIFLTFKYQDIPSF